MIYDIMILYTIFNFICLIDILNFSNFFAFLMIQFIKEKRKEYIKQYKINVFFIFLLLLCFMKK